MRKTSSTLLLGTKDVRKLLTEYSIPAIIAMTASSLYNIADSIFIGRGIGAIAIAGLAICFPLMNLAAAFGSLVGVGASSLISVKLGQRDYEFAEKILGNVLILNLIIGCLFSVVALFKIDSILIFFGASEQTLPYAKEYIKIILYGNVITHLYLGLNAILRASGHPTMAMNATLASVAINFILNPFFIFYLDWGIKGAAWSTIISQLISLIGQLIHFSNPNNSLHFKKGIYKLRNNIVKGIISIGMSPFLMNTCSCLIVMLINWGLKEHGGDMSIGAYGIVNRIAFLFVMILMGLNQGMQPIAGYNFGSHQFDRVIKVTKTAIVYGVFIASIGFIMCQFCPTLIVKVFTSETQLIEPSVFGLHIVFAVFPLVGFQMVASNFFISIGMSKQAIFLSLTRQLIFLIPSLIILPRFLGILGVWISIPISDLCATITTATFLIHQIKLFKIKSKEQKPEKN